MWSPGNHIFRAFGRAVRAHFEEELAKERGQAEARRAAVLPRVRAALERLGHHHGGLPVVG